MRPGATHFGAWSIVIVEKSFRDPSPRQNANVNGFVSTFITPCVPQ